MNIDRTSPLKPVSAVQPRENNDARTQKTMRREKAPVTDSASVTISNTQATLTQASAGDINTERVEALKMAIRNGELEMDTARIADALIREAHLQLQSK